MTPGRYPLEPFTAGDTWDGIPRVAIMINGVPPVSPLAIIRMRFTLADSADDTVIEISLAGGGITLVSAANWIFTIPPQAMPGLTVGRWSWHIETISASNIKKTYLQGDQIVLPDL